MSKAHDAFKAAVREQAAAEASIPEPTINDPTKKRSHEKAKTSVHVRLSFEEWKAVRAFALEENTSVQWLFVYAMDQLFRQRGRKFTGTPKKLSPEEAFGSNAPIIQESKEQ